MDDICFIAALLGKLPKDLFIDVHRIYATGKSIGGGFVSVLACNMTMSARTAAFAAVSGAFYINTPGTCLPRTFPFPALLRPGGAEARCPLSSSMVATTAQSHTIEAVGEGSACQTSLLSNRMGSSQRAFGDRLDKEHHSIRRRA